MSINIGNEGSRVKVYKDEKGRYCTYIKGQEFKEDGTAEDIYMSKKLTFKKGVELKNRTEIEVIKGWNSCYRIKTDEVKEDGKPKYKYYDKYFISDFNILEEGVDEPVKSKQETTQQNDNWFSDDMDMLPF